MYLTLEQPIAEVGPFFRRYGADLRHLGLRTVGDALFYFPFRYEDLSRIVPIVEARAGETVALRGIIKSLGSFRSPRRKLLITEALIADETGNATLTWFGQRHLEKVLKPGDEILVSGTAEVGRQGLALVSPSYEPARGVQTHVGRIVPVYPVSGALTPKAMRAIMLRLVENAPALPEILPDEVRTAEKLPSRQQLIETLHFPKNFDELARAAAARDFEQLFLLSIGNAWLKADLARYGAPAVPFNQPAVKSLIAGLPFTLTDGQKRSAWEIIQDIGKGRPMNRLLNGDVGSGKTLVAAIAAVNAAAAGFQSVFLVPTGVLADQHFKTLTKILAAEKVSVALLTAASAALASAGQACEVKREELLREILDGDVKIIVGTHALLEDEVVFSRLAFAVVDEQHRFGVAQRKKLAGKIGGDFLPHLLSMSATPIPRTLALLALGDLAVSVLPEKPPGRQPVKTTVVTKDAKKIALAALRAAKTAGHQSFVVCPRIENDETSDRRSVFEVATELRELAPELKIAELHGRLKHGEKEGIMSSFISQEYDVLVSTTVIEVGVDVPNATLIVIEGAEYFGLAQLHQLRGRVGRGKAAGLCLVAPQSASPDSYRRLKLLERSDDGWRLAEADLETRGPGELLGTAQSGFGDLRLSALKNHALGERARRAAEICFAKDPELAAAPALRELVRSRFAEVQLS